MSLFNPTVTQVREFFVGTFGRYERSEPLDAMGKLAIKWILQHPEYFAILRNHDATHAEFKVAAGQTNPFLHLSMHLSIEEQLSIDSPRGIRAVFDKLAAKKGEHEAHHVMMESLGQIIWESQRAGRPPDQDRYLELLTLRSE